MKETPRWLRPEEYPGWFYALGVGGGIVVTLSLLVGALTADTTMWRVIDAVAAMGTLVGVVAAIQTRRNRDRT